VNGWRSEAVNLMYLAAGVIALGLLAYLLYALLKPESLG
jgi:K+-transporting ATPase KdpF subunit